jgi:UDP-N-acetylmuramyl pentapeptide synthase/poly-gamma-glutamate capsule biosynthesis protein CapA/YwtB (metallophosphatase superfamily)
VAQEPAQPSGPCGTVAWGGDVNLGRRQHYRTRELGGARQVLGRIGALRDADLRIVNLECVVATTGPQGVDKDETGSYYYRARPEMIEVLTATRIDLVSTANNHSGDYGPHALLEQKALLAAAGIGSAGSGADLEAALQPAIRQAGGVRVALFSLDATQPQFGATAATPGAAYLPLSDPGAWTATLAPRIARARTQADVVLVAVHWGDNLETVPSQAEIAVGHAIVDAGADAVLGASAHVLQGIEVYRGRPVVHDAGDLLFDAMRSDFVDAGVFTLVLNPNGVEQVRFTPIGVGFGFSEPYVGDRARAASERFAAQCRALGTKTAPTPEGGCAVRLAPPERAGLPPAIVLPATAPAAPIPRGSPPPLQAARPEWTVGAVPEDAAMPPLQVGPLRLLGVRCAPTQVFGRQLLWVESFWTADAPVEADLRIQFRAVPMRSKTMPAWGEGMDHDPCDWMWPTSRWEPGRIYRDRYGLRPPLPRQMESDVLQLELRLRGAAKLYKLPKPRRLPVWCGLRMPGQPVALPDGPAPVLAASRHGAGNTAAPPAPVWTADQLAQATGGTWLVAPPEGWSVQSVVRLPLHLRTRPRPALFVASDYATLAAHENFSRPPETWDQHGDLQRLHPQLAGAIVQRAVPGLPPGFPLLRVEDPIAALLALGAAARERFQGRVVGVTGTVGKSSTISMLRDLLPPAARVLTTIENNNSRVGVPGALASLGPDVDVCILEMAQSALWMDRGPISLMARPHVAILTEVGLSQTVKADTLEKTADYKSRIFLGLEPGGVAVIGAHIPCLVQVVRAAMRTAAKVWTVGTGPDANVRLLEAQPVPEGCRVRIAIRRRTHEYLFPIASAGLVRNSALAFTAMVAMGFDAEEACARMPRVRLPASVMQVLQLTTRAGVQATLVDDSWNAEVMSMRNAMEFVRSYRKPGDEPVARRIGVLGRIVNLGSDAEKMHRSLAEPLLASGIDHVVTHGEEMRWLREEVPARLLGPHFDSAALLARYVEDILRDGDLLLVKGDRDLSDFGEIPQLLQKL